MLPVGSQLYRKYKAELVEHPHKASCYISSLTVSGVRLRDGRSYTMMVENKHGRDTVHVLLSVKGEDDAVQGDFCSKALLVKILVETSSIHLSHQHTQFFQFS